MLDLSLNLLSIMGFLALQLILKLRYFSQMLVTLGKSFHKLLLKLSRSRLHIGHFESVSIGPKC
jgi:hypothetical protein